VFKKPEPKPQHKEEVIERAVQEALSLRFKKEQEEKYANQIKELEDKIKLKEVEIEDKMTMLKREQDEVDEIEKLFRIHKADTDTRQEAVDKEVERLQDKANVKELENEKPAGANSVFNN
jgi:gamma-glutamyl:cysteine ligase YbdK (ATP-grasp superfamily)